MSTIDNPPRLARLRCIVCLLFAPPACAVQGSGVLLEESRDTPEFDRIEVSAGLQARVSPGPTELVVRGDDNIVPLVSAMVHERVLVIEPEDNFEPAIPLWIHLHTPTLLGASLEAGGKIVVADIDADELELELSAGGEIAASGAVDRLDVHLSAGGTIDATDLPARSVALAGDAGGTIRVHAVEEVEGLIESGSRAQIHGDPEIRDVHTKSGGHVDYFGD